MLTVLSTDSTSCRESTAWCGTGCWPDEKDTQASAAPISFFSCSLALLGLRLLFSQLLSTTSFPQPHNFLRDSCVRSSCLGLFLRLLRSNSCVSCSLLHSLTHFHSFFSLSLSFFSQFLSPLSHSYCDAWLYALLSHLSIDRPSLFLAERGCRPAVRCCEMLWRCDQLL